VAVLDFEQAGAIDSLSFDLPEDRGGVMLFLGKNGFGKTTAIYALQGLLGAKVAINPRDGAKVGTVQGLGRRLSLGKRQSSTGGTTVNHLGDRLDVGKLVDPGLVDPKARDKHRVRALVSLAATDAKIEDFLDRSLSQYVDLDAASELDDPIKLADFVKRSIERAALDCEKRADVKAELAKAKRVEAGDVDDLAEQIDHPALVSAHRQATIAVEEHRRSVEIYSQTVTRNKATEAAIDKAFAEYTGGTVDELTTQHAQLAEKITDLRQRLAMLEKSEAATKAKLNAAIAHNKRIADLKALIKPAGDEPVDRAAELAALSDSAYQALLDADQNKRRREAFDASVELQRESAAISDDAVKLREAAKGIQSKVQALLPAGPVEVIDGELKVKHARRGKHVLFDELSMGERWSVAMHYAIGVVGEGGVIPVSQEAWQSLDSDNRQIVLDLCRAHKVWVISAQVEDCELTVAEYE